MDEAPNRVKWLETGAEWQPGAVKEAPSLQSTQNMTAPARRGHQRPVPSSNQAAGGGLNFSTPRSAELYGTVTIPPPELY